MRICERYIHIYLPCIYILHIFAENLFNYGKNAASN